MKNDPKEIGFCKWVFIVSKLLNIAVNDFDAKKPAHIDLAFNIDQINSVNQGVLVPFSYLQLPPRAWASCLIHR